LSHDTEEEGGNGRYESALISGRGNRRRLDCGQSDEGAVILLFAISFIKSN